MIFPGIDNRHFLVLVSNCVTVAVGFSLSYLLFHFLSIEAVGMWFFIMSIIAFLESIRFGFLSTSVIAFYAGATRERGAIVLGSVWFLALVLSIVVLSLNAGIAFLVLPHTHNAELILCIKWVGLTFFSSLPVDVIVWRLQADERYDKMLMYKMLYNTSTVAVMIMLILLHKMSLENALLYNFLANSAVSLLGVMLNLSGIQYLLKRTKDCIWELIHFGKYNVGTTSLSYLLANADTWFIQFMLGPATVAIYNLAKRFMAVIEMPLQTFLTTGMSAMSICYNKKDLPQLAYIFKKYSGMITIALVPLVLVAVIFADVPINFIGGAKYHDSIAANISRLLLVATLLFPLDRFNGLALDVIRQNKSNFYKVVLMLTIKIVGNFIGVAILGNIYGIVFSNFLIITSAIFFGYYHLRRSINYTIPEVLDLGYKEVKLLIKRNIEVVPLRTQKIKVWTKNFMSRK